MSYKEVYDEEIEGLFGNLREKHSRVEVDKVDAEGTLAPLVPLSISGADVFDSTDTMDILAYVPDEMLRVVKARIVLSFREFFAPATAATAAASGTSGTQSTPSGGGATSGGSASGLVFTQCPFHGGHAHISNLQDHDHTTPNHIHPAHDHSVPAHGHALTYGVFKETMPASHSVEIRVYKWSGSAWSLLDTITGLTATVVDVELDDSISGPGKYRISIKSAGGQPNGGRLGCDAAGFVIGAMQPI